VIHLLISWKATYRCFLRGHIFEVKSIVLTGKQVSGPLIIPAHSTVEIGVVFANPVEKQRCSRCGKLREVRGASIKICDWLEPPSTGSL